MITSVRNPKVQWVRLLQERARDRRLENVFVVEGVRLAEEAVQSGWRPLLVLYTDSLSTRGLEIVEQCRVSGAEVEPVSDDVMRSASDTKSPQGIILVLEKREIPLPEKLGFVLILDGLRDPGNLGAILRTADSAAVELVFLTPNSVDPFSPKVVRAGMGAHFHLPVQEASWEDIDGCIQTNGLRVYLASPDDGTQYYRTDFHQPFALIIGGEAQGASNLAFQTSDQRVHIPMPGGSESLNAGAAAAILLFEAVRQREVAN